MRSILSGVFVTLAVIVVTGMLSGVLGLDFGDMGQTHPRECVASVALLMVGWVIAYAAGRGDGRSAIRTAVDENARLRREVEGLNRRLEELNAVSREARRAMGVAAAKRDEDH